ncbi:hypothetical protein HFO38_00515 [Rhizobium leguminosarum]|uniref:hypothetical protein n=1 Tax=Rhizobium leguminosarum TaxID=384 RepID=UPI001C960D15|nr:hypothetical protein [Rhizobium leguminosarum]MBY5701215.1 hypothetical protein [Rhizobium leguminosarum]
MAKTIKPKRGNHSPASKTVEAPEVAVAELDEAVGTAVVEAHEAIVADNAQTDSQAAAVTLEPWSSLKVAIIDDAMHPPRLDRFEEKESRSVAELLMTDVEVTAELETHGCPNDATADRRLLLIASTDVPLLTLAKIGAVSSEALRMIEEHRTFLRLKTALEEEVGKLEIVDPYKAIPDLTSCQLILLDYYLEGSAKGGDTAISVANTIREQANRPDDQQIVLMSSIETVRDLRIQFRGQTNLTGSAFAFIGKPDLNEKWKVKAHLGMLERARPYAPAFSKYRDQLEVALAQAKVGLLSLVDDLDIGDYAFLQGRALMKDGHPLGDYMFWLLSSQFTALAFEQEGMRARQRELDALEFDGEPVAATEPSLVVANMLHSALVSREVGPLGPHPRAAGNDKYGSFPLVQLGDVFLDKARSKAVVVMSADCDLAFSPLKDREPDAETPVMLVPGLPIKLRDATDEPSHRTDGIVHKDEVYRIAWDFSKYRSVGLGELQGWLTEKGFDTSNRDRLRPLFALKLQQEFGSHLLRVGPPLMPPMTTSATGRVIVHEPERHNFKSFGPKELMLTRFKETTTLRVTPNIASALKEACEELHSRLNDQLPNLKDKAKEALEKKIESLSGQIANDKFWIELLRGIDLNAKGSEKRSGPLGFVLGADLPDGGNPRVIIQIEEEKGKPAPAVGSALEEPEQDTAAVSGAG